MSISSTAASWADYRNGKGPRGTEFDFAIANWGPGTNPYVLEPFMVGTLDMGYWPLDIERDYHWAETSPNAERAKELWAKIFAEKDIEAQTPYFKELDCILNEEVFIPQLIGESWIALKSKRLQGVDLDLNVSVYIVPMMVDIAKLVALGSGGRFTVDDFVPFDLWSSGTVRCEHSNGGARNFCPSAGLKVVQPTFQL